MIFGEKQLPVAAVYLAITCCLLSAVDEVCFHDFVCPSSNGGQCDGTKFILLLSFCTQFFDHEAGFAGGPIAAVRVMDLLIDAVY